jgi:PKD repeat protein
MKRIVLAIFLFLILGYVVFAQSCPSQTTFTSNSAVLVGEITNHGGDPNLEVWFKWGQGSSLSNETSHQFIYASFLPYRFCSSISGLQPCTTYSYQAVARNTAGVQYGEVFTFTTRCQTSQPIVTSSLTNRPPVALINYSPREISPGTLVTFDGSRSYDPDGYIVSYSWKIDGILVSTQRSFTRSFSSGNYEVELTVTDNQGLTDSEKLLLHVGKNIRTTVTRTVTRNVPVYVNKDEGSVDLILASNYNLRKCSIEEIKATLVNNTNKTQKVKLALSGDLASWYEPYMQFKDVSYEIAPNSSKDISLKIPVPQVESGSYDLVIKLKNNGKVKTYTTLANVSSEPRYAVQPSSKSTTTLLGSIFDIIGGIFSSSLLVFILIGLNLYLWYQLRKKKATEETF